MERHGDVETRRAVSPIDRALLCSPVDSSPGGYGMRQVDLREKAAPSAFKVAGEIENGAANVYIAVAN